MLTVPNCSGPGTARLLRKHLAEAAISKNGIFSAPDCWILVSNPSQTGSVSSLRLPLNTLALTSQQSPRLVGPRSG